jgi:hypothetical protein
LIPDNIKYVSKDPVSASLSDLRQWFESACSDEAVFAYDYMADGLVRKGEDKGTGLKDGYDLRPHLEVVKDYAQAKHSFRDQMLSFHIGKKWLQKLHIITVSFIIRRMVPKIIIVYQILFFCASNSFYFVF